MVDNALLGGPFPGSSSAAGAERQLAALLDAGLRTFVSLMEPAELNHAGEPFNVYEPDVVALAKQRGIEITLHRFPIPDYGTVTTAVYRRILSVINTSIESHRPVYLHCMGGHGRTGTVVGCWLREQGFGPEEALDHIAELREHSDYLKATESPETDDQRAVVRTWTPESA